MERGPKLVQLGQNSCFANKDLIEKGKATCQKAKYFSQQKLQMVQNFDVLGSESLFFFCTLLKVLEQDINSSIILALIIIDVEVVSREFLGSTNLFGAQTFCIYKLSKFIMVGKYEKVILKTF